MEQVMSVTCRLVAGKGKVHLLWLFVGLNSFTLLMCVLVLTVISFRVFVFVSQLNNLLPTTTAENNTWLT